MSDIQNELANILQKQKDVVNLIAVQLMNDLKKATPVDTGYLKQSWFLVDNKDGSYTINNPTEYAEIRLLPAITNDNGKLIQGSLKFPAGIESIIDKYDRKLQRMLNAI